MLELLLKLNELTKLHEADGVKVYYKDENNYTVKFIKNEKVIKVYRKHECYKTKSWDIKHDEVK